MIRRSVILLMLLAFSAAALLANCATTVRATEVRVERASPEDFLGSVVVTVDGVDRTIAEEAVNAWLIDRGRAVVYSGTDGAGGFEDEGQSLWRYDVRTGSRRKLMTEVFAITKVVETRARSGRTALLVSMADGGLGAPHIAVVHPTRGQVFRHRFARFVGVRNGRIAVGVYTVRELEMRDDPRPERILYHDLDALLRRQASPHRPISVP